MATGWFTFSHAMHERIGFLPLVSLRFFPRFFFVVVDVVVFFFFPFFFFFVLFLLRIPAATECDAPPTFGPRLSLEHNVVRATRMLIASSYQNPR